MSSSPGDADIPIKFPKFNELKTEAIRELGWSFGYCIKSKTQFKKLFVGICDDIQVKDELTTRCNSECAEAMNRAEKVYVKQLTEIYTNWTILHHNIPYLYQKNLDERRLTRLYSKQLLKKERIDTIENLRKQYYNPLKAYKEWIYIHKGTLPTMKNKPRRSSPERKLAKWAINVHSQYNEGLLDSDYIQQIIEELGVEWLEFKDPVTTRSELGPNHDLL
jgi:hypothetical protein